MTIFSAISGAAKTVGRVARQAKNTVGGNMPKPFRRATMAAVEFGRASQGGPHSSKLMQRAGQTLMGRHNAPSQNQMTPENRLGKQFMRRQVRDNQVPESRQLMGFKEFLNEINNKG